MHDVVVISVPVILAALLSVVGATALELRNHRDRLTRIETLLETMLERDRRHYSVSSP